MFMKKQNKMKNKKAVSTMVSYVLLIVIALGLASGVFAWLKFYATPPTDEGLCPKDVALTIKDYSCDTDEDTLTLKIENKGLFSIEGFFIKGAKERDKLSTIPLIRTDQPDAIDGRYDFVGSLSPRQTITTKFSYTNLINITGSSLKRIEMQPFVIEEGNIAVCDNRISLNLELTCD